MPTIGYTPTKWLAARDVPAKVVEAVLAELKSIHAGESLNVLKLAAEDHPGARIRLAGILRKHGAKPAWDDAPASRKVAPPSKQQDKPAASKAAASKKAASSTRPAPSTKPASSKKPKAEKPKATSATSKKPKPEKKPAAKRGATKKSSAGSALKDRKAELKAANAKLRDELAEHRVSCPPERANAVRDAAAALAAAKTAAAFSPALAIAKGQLKAALDNVVGYKAARKAIAEAEKSPTVTEAKAALERARTEARGEAMGVLQQAADSPEVRLAEAALRVARRPDEVLAAVETLSKAKAMCALRAAAIKDNHAGKIADLQRTIAQLSSAEPNAGLPATAESILASIAAVASAASGPPTTLSTGSSRRAS